MDTTELNLTRRREPMTREELLYVLTGTEEPKFITERENEMIDKFLILLQIKHNDMLMLSDFISNLNS